MARDTTTFPLVDPDVENDINRDPTGPVAPGLGKITPTRVWKCRQCGYAPVDEKTGICYNCGRNFVGEDVGVPDAKDKPARPQVRSDGR